MPSNDFGGQEPGGATDINKTAHEEYHVTFPIAAKAQFVKARVLIHSIGGPWSSGRWTHRAGISTNT